MAKSPSPEETTVEAGTPPPAKKSILGKLLVLVLVLAVVAVECVVAYLCIPTTSSAAVPTNNAKPPAEHKHGEAESGAASEGDGMAEVDLKEFSITIYQAASNSTLRIDFHLAGIVAKQDEKDFKKLLDENMARFREQVTITIRGAEMADLTDPSLGLIKRTILAKAKAILGQPLLKEIIISDYSWMEQ